jgi:hypothetical protein
LIGNLGLQDVHELPSNLQDAIPRERSGIHITHPLRELAAGVKLDGKPDPMSFSHQQSDWANMSITQWVTDMNQSIIGPRQ